MQIIENFKYSVGQFNTEQDALDFLIKWSWKDALSLISDKKFQKPRQRNFNSKNTMWKCKILWSSYTY